MNWEDCVVDVHSVKIMPAILEEMFGKCGPLRSMVPWKGQNEKPHIFFEYKSAASTDAARTIGLERNDVQVIKILNNELLKRKFRELAHGPLRDCDPRAKTPGRFVQPHKSAMKAHGLPVKPTPPCSEPMDWTDKPHTRRIDDLNERDRSIRPSRSRSRGPRNKHSLHSPEIYSRNCTRPHPGQPPKQVFKPPETPQSSPENKSLNTLHIPYAGEYIKLDMETQLESDPSGIIKMLTVVKGDQKLWMMTAAYYKSKHKFDAAKKVLEAGIDMAARVGIEGDTKPFWHLLDQINEIIRSCASHQCPVLHSQRAQPAITCGGKGSTRPSPNEYTPLKRNDSSLFRSSPPPNPSPCASPAALPSITGQETRSFSRNTNSISSQVKETEPSFPPPGPRIRDKHGISFPAVRVTRQHCDLQKEVRVLREKQDIVMEELSSVRAAKRRAEEGIKEERTVRRKLETNLRIMEDVLSRSKRLESTALDQVKREVEARRQAQSLVEKLKADAQKSTVAPPPASKENSAGPLLQLLTLLRNIPPTDVSPTSQPRVNLSPLSPSDGISKDTEPQK